MTQPPSIDTRRHEPLTRHWVTRSVVALAAALIVSTYLVDLDDTPIYFGGDEAHFAVIGESLARTGANLAGDRFPVFIRLDGPADQGVPAPPVTAWYQPFLFYVIALVLKVLPLSEATVRLPVAVIGSIINPLLMYAVGCRLFRSRPLAILGAALLLVSPPHLILSRQALDYIGPIPFVLTWLWCMLLFADTGRLRFAGLAGLALGVGCYSYIASWAMMPGFLAVSWVVLWHLGGRWPRAVACITAGFVAAILPAGWWLWSHPQVLLETAERYHLVGDELPGAGFSPTRLLELISLYWQYFDPVFLFVRGGPSMTTSTTFVGVFLLPIAIALPVGVYGLLRTGRGPWPWVVACGLLAAPVPAVLVGESGMIQREMLLLPFAALTCVYGVIWLQGVTRFWRPLLGTALALLAIQYTVFVSDYWGSYKFRSAFYYDPVVFAQVADTIVHTDRANAIPRVYFSADLDDVAPKWRFYLAKLSHRQLLERTRHVAAGVEPVDAVPAGSLWVLYDTRELLNRMAAEGRWRQVAAISDIGDRVAAVILQRTDLAP